VTVALATSASTSQAQEPPPGFTIKNDNATFSLSGIPSKPTNLPASADLRVGGKGNPNQAFQTWWWYRLPGETRESAINAMNPVWNKPAPNEANANFNLGPNLASTMAWSIQETAGSTGLLHSTLTVTNNGKAAIDLTIFHYLDLDLGGTANDDTARYAKGEKKTDPPNLWIGDPNWFARYIGNSEGFTHYDSDAFPKVRDLLTNNAKDDFPDNQLWFMVGTGDWTGGFEWERTIQPGAKTNFGISVELGPRAMPEPSTFWLFLVGVAGTALLLRLRNTGVGRFPRTGEKRDTQRDEKGGILTCYE
jgi:hypothetical protein